MIRPRHHVYAGAIGIILQYFLHGVGVFEL